MIVSGSEKLVGLVVAALGAMGVIAYYWRSRRKTPEEVERARCLDLHRRGRLTSGEIIDVVEPQADPRNHRLVVYRYDVAGVRYEVAQDLTRLPQAYELAQRMLGNAIYLKYDTQQPANSIIACEHWSGIPSPSPQASSPGLVGTSSGQRAKAGS